MAYKQSFLLLIMSVSLSSSTRAMNGKRIPREFKQLAELLDGSGISLNNMKDQFKQASASKSPAQKSSTTTKEDEIRFDNITEECSITSLCDGVFEDNTRVVQCNTCQSIEFCEACILEWKKRNNTCPKCRANLPNELVVATYGDIKKIKQGYEAEQERKKKDVEEKQKKSQQLPATTTIKTQPQIAPASILPTASNAQEEQKSILASKIIAHSLPEKKNISFLRNEMIIAYLHGIALQRIGSHSQLNNRKKVVCAGGLTTLFAPLYYSLYKNYPQPTFKRIASWLGGLTLGIATPSLVEKMYGEVVRKQ